MLFTTRTCERGANHKHHSARCTSTPVNIFPTVKLYSRSYFHGTCAVSAPATNIIGCASWSKSHPPPPPPLKGCFDRETSWARWWPTCRGIPVSLFTLTAVVLSVSKMVLIAKRCPRTVSMSTEKGIPRCVHPPNKTARKNEKGSFSRYTPESKV